jgi:hypothetical protein
MPMKRLLLVMLMVAVPGLMAGSAFAQTPAPARSAKIAEPETLGSVKLEDVQPGMRVRLQLAYGKPIVGTVTQMTLTTLVLDLSTEASGLPGKFRFKRSDIVDVQSLKPQSAQEQAQVIEKQKDTVAKLKVEVTSRIEKSKTEDRKTEAKAKAEDQDFRKALDVVVAKEQEDKMRALLAKFPPGDKWNEETFRVVRERWVLYKLAPSPEESDFLKAFVDWKDARDTIAILDAHNQDKEGDKLLLKFPPSLGWGKDRLAAITAKEAAGTALKDEETEFRKSYDAWARAVARRAAQVPLKTPTDKVGPIPGEPPKPIPQETTPPTEPRPDDTKKNPDPAADLDSAVKPPPKPAEEKPADKPAEGNPAP